MEEGIKIAQSKSHPGKVEQWKKELLRIAVAEKDTAAIRLYTKYFAFSQWFSPAYYQQWKETFTQQEWKVVIESHLNETIKKVTDEWMKNKHKMWRPTAYPPLLQYVGSIYIMEKYWDRLLKLVQQANDLNITLEYHPHLVKNYPAELLAIYLPAFEEYGTQANDRSAYADLDWKMKKIITDIPEGKEKIIAIAKRLITKFSVKPRRPAMIEELTKVL